MKKNENNLINNDNDNINDEMKEEGERNETEESSNGWRRRNKYQ